MATTKKSTKAKTKTSKKPATKTTRAAKTTKSSVSTKAVKPAVTKKPASKKQTVGTAMLMRLNILSGVLALALAVAAGFLMKATTYQVFTGLVTKDELASTAAKTTVFAPAIHSVFDLELRWAVVGILVLSAIIPLLAATRARKQYEESLGKKVMLWRWVDMAIVSALMVEVIALLSGVQDLMTLKLIGAFMVITCVLGYFTEKQNAVGGKNVWGNYYLSLVTGTLPWLLIAVYAIGSVVYGDIRSPWYVYALYGSTLVAFLGYVGNGMRQLQAKQDYEVTERNSLQLGIFAKVAFAIILIVGLYKK